MLPGEKITFREMLDGVEAVDFSFVFRFKRSQTGNLDEHDHVAIVCNDKPEAGFHIARVCLCCIGNVSVNPYERFSEAISKERYDQMSNYVHNLAFTDVDKRKFYS